MLFIHLSKSPKKLFRKSKGIITLLALVMACLSLQAKTYYFSSSTGNDSRSNTEAQNVATPWRTIQKLNTIMSQLLPGDFVLFKRGESFDGSIVITKAGTSASPIVFGAYGSGAKPIITGFTTASSFTSVGGGVYESNVLAAGSVVNIVLVNGQEFAMGRYPNDDAANGGYLNFEAHGTNSITDNELSSAVNWTGADVVVRSSRWTIDRMKILSHIGTTILYATPATYTLINKYGYFIQNSDKALDKFGEWYYNPVTKRVRVFFGASLPQNVSVQVSALDNLLTFSASNITVENLNFWGSNGDAVKNIGNLQNISLQNCYFLNSGVNALNFSGETSGILVDSCTIENTNNNAIILTAGCVNATITQNVIANTGMYAGMGKNGDGNYIAIRCDAPGFYAENNRITRVGYSGLSFSKDNVTIKNNLIDSFCVVKDDGAGIYTSTGSSNTVYYNRKITGNIILDGVGAKYGVDVINSYLPAVGIYIDENATNLDISNNTVANCANNGMNVHNARLFSVTNNTFYNNFMQFATSHGGSGNAISGGVIKNNFFIAKTATQITGSYFSVANDVASLGIIDSNIYARPLADSLSLKMEFPNIGWGYKTIAYWQSYSGKDAKSKKSPKKISNVNEFDFKYNATNRSVTYNFPGLSKMDVAGNVYNNSAVIPAWSSKVLLANGSATIVNLLPESDAGNDITITLPVNTTTLRGIGTDADGTVSSYAWEKISGPSAGTIATANNATTVLNSLVQGIYQFELTVTDDDGAKGYDTVKVTVKAPIANQLPVANAGTDISITLPVNTAALNGSGFDNDGSIGSYAWVKIAGPSSGTIASSASASTTVNSLVQGVYRYELTVTDNNGGIDKDTVQVTVNAGVVANIPPVANAGADKSIVLPIVTTVLTGSGTDADGTIRSYAWRKISGPALGSILNLGSAVTTLISLVQGVYQFELTVTDDDGATDKDTVQVTVNPLIVIPNIAPVANAGADKVITLPVNTTTLTGSGTDADGSIVRYAWVKIAGPSSGTIFSGASPSTALNSLVEGVYRYELTVTDNDGATDTDIVQVTVNAAVVIPNIAPVANAGADKVITLPVNTTTLTGSGTDADGSIVRYAWVKIAGPSSGTIFSGASPTTALNSLVEGIYRYELTVTDNDGATATDIVQVTVNAALATPPALLPAVNPVNIVNGVNYKYYEGSWDFLPSFDLLNPVEAGVSNNFDISLANSFSDFGFSFTGYVEVPADGQYTFFTSSDDGSSLYIDDVLVVNNDGEHALTEKSGKIGLEAGKHYIKVLYFQGPAGRSLTVSYQGDGVPKQLIPLTSLYRDNLLPAVYPANAVNGVDYKYYEGVWSFLPSFDLLTPVKTGTSNTFDLTLADTVRDFGFSFTGYVEVPDDGQYTFFTTSDDGSSLYIDDVLVVNNDGKHAAIEKSGTIGLMAGKHNIKVLYFQGPAGRSLSVSYQGVVVPKQIIPVSSLYRINNTSVARGVASTSNSRSSGSNIVTPAQPVSTTLKTNCFPNPSTSNFNLSVQGNNEDKVAIFVRDITGKIVYTTTGTANRKYSFGDKLGKGVYFVVVTQGNHSQTSKIIKL